MASKKTRKLSFGNLDLQFSFGKSEKNPSITTVGLQLDIKGKKISAKRLSFSNSAVDIFQEAAKEVIAPVTEVVDSTINSKSGRRRSQSFSDIFGKTVEEPTELSSTPRLGLEGYEINFQSVFTKPEMKEAFRNYLSSEFNRG
jgi:virulence-associated protein VagC